MARERLPPPPFRFPERVKRARSTRAVAACKRTVEDAGPYKGMDGASPFSFPRAAKGGEDKRGGNRL